MPKIEQILHQPAGGRPASPADFGGGEGLAALGKSSKEAGDVMSSIAEAAQVARTNKGIAEYQRRVHDLRDSYQDDEELAGQYESHEEMFAAEEQKIRGEIRERMPGGVFKSVFDREVSRIGERSRLAVRQNVRARTIAEANADDLAAHDDDINSAIRGDSDEYLEAVRRRKESIAGLVSRGVIKKDAGELRFQDFKDKAQAGRAERFIRLNPWEAEEELKDEHGDFADMNETVRGRYIDRAKAEQQRRIDTHNAQQEADRKRQTQMMTEARIKVNKLLAIEADGGDLTPEMVYGYSSVLTDDDFKAWLKVAREGGGAQLRDPDPKYYAAQISMMINDRAKFADPTRNPIDPVAAGNKYIPLLEDQARASKGQLSEMRTFQKRVDDRLEMEDWNDEDDRFELLRQAETALEEFEFTEGQKATGKQMESIIDTMFLHMKRRRYGWRATVMGDYEIMTYGLRGRQATPDVFTVPGVPVEHIDKMLYLMQKGGHRVSEQSVLEFYRIWKSKE